MTLPTQPPGQANEPAADATKERFRKAFRREEEHGCELRGSPCGPAPAAPKVASPEHQLLSEHDRPTMPVPGDLAATPRIHDVYLNWANKGDHMKKLVELEDYQKLERALVEARANYKLACDEREHFFHTNGSLRTQLAEVYRDKEQLQRFYDMNLQSYIELSDQLAAMTVRAEKAEAAQQEQFRLYCEETKKHNETAARLRDAREQIDFDAEALTEHAEAVGVSPDHINYIEETTKAIIRTWADNSDLRARLAQAEAERDRAFEYKKEYGKIAERTETELTAALKRVEELEASLDVPLSSLNEQMNLPPTERDWNTIFSAVCLLRAHRTARSAGEGRT